MNSRKETKPSNVIRLIDRAKFNFAQKVNYHWKALHLAFASFLSRKESALSQKRKKVYFFLFFGAFSIVFFYLVADGVNGFFGSFHNKKKGIIENLNFGSIHNVPVRETANVLNSREKRIFRYISYLDSLKSSPSGKIKFDSIVKSRPGLIDTLHYIKFLSSKN